MKASSIYEYPAYKPESNFPEREKKEKPEAFFAEQFARAYQKKFSEIHSRTSKNKTLFIREVPISGNGIPDLLVFSWSNVLKYDAISPFRLRNLSPTLRTFEIKISDWRKGLMQAHRYHYFSHASFLVLPWNKIRLIEANLDIFKILRIGIWLFDQKSDRITNIFTPRPQKPQNIKCAEKAIDLTDKTISL